MKQTCIVPAEESTNELIKPCPQQHQDPTTSRRPRHRKMFASRLYVVMLMATVISMTMYSFMHYFVFNSVDSATAADLLFHPSGPASWLLSPSSPHLEPSSSVVSSKNTTTSAAGVTLLEERCALCFFGLPRAFQSMVLPSVIENVLTPNARHNCDVYVHFYEQTQDSPGRLNGGGTIDPRQMLSLESEVYRVQEQQQQHGGNTSSSVSREWRKPTVNFTWDNDEAFAQARGGTIRKYHTAINPEDGKLMYFPYTDFSYQNSSIDNIVRQWHSIERVFHLMEASGRALGVNYTRVGMFRSDVMYLRPVDIWLLDNGIVDRANTHVVVPGFAQYPVNDRMIYGAYHGVKVWATERFSLIEQRAIENPQPGYVMHSERFLNGTVFPAIQAALGTRINVNRDICFFRTRADESVIISDCSMRGTIRGWDKVDRKAIVEQLLGKKCVAEIALGWKMEILGCGKGVDYSKIYNKKMEIKNPNKDQWQSRKKNPPSNQVKQVRAKK